MKILVDENLSVTWVPTLRMAGYDAVHWRDVGATGASDFVIMEWARYHNHVVFTHDLEFNATLCATGAMAPSVIQLITEDNRPEIMAESLLTTLRLVQETLELGALIAINPTVHQIRLIPLVNSSE